MENSKTVDETVEAAVVVHESANGSDAIEVKSFNILNTAVSGASTPEEAARLFAKYASPLLAQAAADALQAVLGKVSMVTVADHKIAGWPQHIIKNGMGMCLDWGSPTLSNISTLPVGFCIGKTPPDFPILGIEGSVNVTIRGTF
jgi:hypothetical protein